MADFKATFKTSSGGFSSSFGKKNRDFNSTGTGNGTLDHSRLLNRDKANQHPISAIEGLEGELARIPEKVSDLPNDAGYISTETDPTVPAWAKAESKPTYTAEEVGALSEDTVIPEKVSDLTNDSGFISTETDPTVPSWAKAETKPTYTAEEVGALPEDTVIPEKVSDLTNDSGFISTETDPTVPSWAKASTKPTYTAVEVGALPASTYIPNKTSDLTNDSGFITGYTETDPTVPSWAKSVSKPTYTAAEVGALPDTTDLSVYMQKGVDRVTAGQKSGTTLGNRATAEGYNAEASGNNSHAEGNGTVANYTEAHAEGNGSIASAQAAHAEGFSATASGHFSHAEGQYTVASGVQAHAEGYRATASGDQSHVEGYYTTANHKSQHVFGEFNVLDASTAAATLRGNYVEIVGNGTQTYARSNARTLDWNGNEVLAGKLTVGAAPTASMDVTTKQYVDTAISGINGLPSQSGQNGKFLTTNGTAASWAAVSVPTKVSDLTNDSGYLTLATLPIYDGTVV